MTSEAARQRFRELILPRVDDAYRLARWITASPRDAEDVTQEAVMRAFEKMDSYAGGDPRSWLLTITRRVAYAWLARNRPAAVMLSDDLAGAEAAALDGWRDGAPTPEAIVIAAEEEDRLIEAIEALPVPYRETLALRDIEGLSYREVAAVLDVPVGTVMSRLARARGLLIKALGEPR